jgi:NifU-like protein involved in Fe-S cluster formation
MVDPLEAFLDEAQADLDRTVREEWGEAVYRRWREPRYQGALRDPDAQAHVRGRCGDGMEMFLRFRHGRVARAGFRTDGCGPSLVCGSLAAEMAHGKTVEELFGVTGEAILKALGGLPQEYEHCAHLAASALHAAADGRMRALAGHGTRGFGSAER